MRSTPQDSRPRSESEDRGHDYYRVLTGAGTVAGRYLRRFWQPVYHSVDIAGGQTTPLRILGEAFTLYRGTGGTLVLTESSCPHRGAQLSAGRVEGATLRCFYHGWRFAPDGTCVEQPAENSRFCDKVSLRVYPVREYLGLVFAYLGDGDPPEFPLFPPFERFAGLVEVDSYLRPCNFFQNLENALDMSHVAFVHQDNVASFAEIGRAEQLRAEESEWGVRYSFTRADGRSRVQQFGMPNIFYMTALPNDPDIGWQESLFWWVPIDDEAHMQFSIHRVPAEGEVAHRIRLRRQERRSRIDLAHQDVCRRILDGEMTLAGVDTNRVDLVRLQDDIAQVGQGVIARSDREWLGHADIGVVTLRRLWRRELNALAEDGALKAWRWGQEIAPEAWRLRGGEHRLGEGQSATMPPAEIIDVRPYVEVAAQLKALRGGRGPR